MQSNGPSPVKVLFATCDPLEAERFAAARGDGHFELKGASSLQEIDGLFSSGEIDLIVTDFKAYGGGFADWLSLWPLPFILFVDPGDEKRLDEVMHDEASGFITRREDLSHVDFLPSLAKKILNTRESLHRQNMHLELSERRYMELMQALPDIVFTLDSSGCFTYLNEAIRSLGYEPAALIGVHFSQIVDSDDLPRVSREIVLKDFMGKVTGSDGSPKLFDERRTGARMTRGLDVRPRRNETLSDGSVVATVDSFGEISARGINLPECEGVGIGTVGIIRDISKRKQREIALEEGIEAKETRLREIHHRVKNNLQVISSLLSLQGDKVRDERAVKVFADCQTQIHSIAMVHEQLYRSTDLSKVSLDEYFHELLTYLFGVYDSFSLGVDYRVSAKEASLDIDRAIPLALITVELVTNALKHAFPAGRGGMIELSASVTPEGCLSFRIQDDGVGIAEGSSPAEGIGMDIVEALADQLGARLRRESASGTGTGYELSFPLDPGAQPKVGSRGR
jgi:PAS domain S-box-containing protein